jgi:hypothetical protein
VLTYFTSWKPNRNVLNVFLLISYLIYSKYQVKVHSYAASNYNPQPQVNIIGGKQHITSNFQLCVPPTFM